MHKNILQQFGESVLSPHYQKNWPTFQDKPLSHYNSTASQVVTDKENKSSSELDIIHSLPVSESALGSDVQSRDHKDGVEDNTTRIEDYNRCMPYTVNNFMAYRQRAQLNSCAFNKSTKSEDDVANDTYEHMRTGDMPSSTNTSFSTHESSSPKSTGSPPSPTQSMCSPSGSEESNQSSTGEPVSSPDSDSKQEKKLKRTSYTNEQLQSLLKIFHENPYPDSEMMETISIDLGVPESKIKIWFQNKRARWRKRVNSGNSTFPQHFMPVSPMLSPIGPYGLMPQGQVMTSLPAQYLLPGYFNYASMHTPAYPSQTANAVAARMRLTYPPMTSSSHQCSGMPQQQAMASLLPNSSRTSPPSSMMMSHNDRYLHYTQFSCPS